MTGYCVRDRQVVRDAADISLTERQVGSRDDRAVQSGNVVVLNWSEWHISLMERMTSMGGFVSMLCS